METIKASIAEIKARGQLTISKKIREMSHLEEGQVVTIIPVGDSLIITPKRLELDEARREIKKINWGRVKRMSSIVPFLQQGHIVISIPVSSNI